MGTTEDALRATIAMGRLANQLDDIKRRLAAVERSAQLGFSSVDGAGITVKDEAGTVRAVLGIQSDGTAGVRVVNGGPPPTTTAPVVLGGLGVIQVAWDGRWDNAFFAPGDFLRVRIHMSADPGFVVGPDNLVASIENPAGGVVTLNVDGYGARYVRLVAENTSGVAGGPSAVGVGVPQQVDGPDIAAGAVTTNHLRAGIIDTSHLRVGVVASNQVANPGFEDPSGTGWTVGATSGGLLASVRNAGNGDLEDLVPRTGRGVGVMPCTSGGAGSWLESAVFPVQAGLLHRAGVYARAVEGEARMNLLVYTGPGQDGPWTPSPRNRANVTVTTAWTRVDANGVQVPAGHGWAKLRFEAVSSTAVSGQVLVDDSMFLLLGFGGSELTGAGLRLYDEDGDPTIDLSSTGAGGQYLSIHRDGATLAMVSSDGVGSFTRTESTMDPVVVGRPLLGAFGSWNDGRVAPPDALMENMPWGIVGFGARAGGETVTNGEIGVFEMSWRAKPGRMYRVEVEPVHVNLSAGCTGGWRVRASPPGSPTDGTAVAGPPSLSSELAGVAYQSNTHASATKPFLIHWSRTFWLNPVGGGGVAPGVNRLLFSLYATGGTATLSTEMVFTANVVDLGPATLDSTVSNSGSRSGSPAMTFTQTWGAEWSATFDINGNYQPDRSGALVYTGYYSAANGGTHKAMIGFPGGVQSALAQAVQINKVEVFLHANYWAQATGGACYVGYHGEGARPAVFSTGGGLTQSDWPRPAGRWITVPEAWWPYFKSGQAKGVTITSPGNSQSLVYYGKFDGVGAVNAPKLRITYRY